MDHRRTILGVVLLLAGFALFSGPGCTTAPAVTDLRLDAGGYDRVFDISQQVLRDAGFRIDRVDRRHGVITTEPVDAGSILEPWRDLHATPAQALESTFNYERRIVRINFESASGPGGGEVESAGGAEAQVASPPVQQAEITADDGVLRVSLQVFIERAHQPGRQIETTSTRRVSFTIDPQLRDRGVPARYWEPVSRDPYLEQHLLEKIAAYAGPLVTVESLE